MIRGMYFMNWYPRDWNYHPMLPPKRLQNVEEIARSGCDMLYWCSMGSGMIGLQFLEEELYGQPAVRTRFYGFLNDSEFAKECADRGIKSFGVIWRAQLWEFPAELNEDETQILSLNKLRGVGKKAWIGMSELSTDRYPHLFKPIKTYFPQGLRNSRGELVKDFLEEFTAKTLEGNKILSVWLMVPGHEHKCYTPCANNTAFRAYIHKEIEMMIDAGTSGIFLDECNTQRYAMYNSGCFCPDCMAGFRRYLKAHPSRETESLDLETFDYGDYLRGLGYTDQDLNQWQQERRLEIPLFRAFIDFSVATNEDIAYDMVRHARAYAKKRNRTVYVTSNLYNFQPETALFRKCLDFYAGENTGITLRQDGFYRFATAFIGGKEGFFTQDYSPYMLEICEDMKNGKNDTYTLMMLEAMAHSCMNSVPYGSWLLNHAKEALWPNLDWDAKLGEWIRENEGLFPRNPAATTALIYDWYSAYKAVAYLNGHVDEPRRAGFYLFHHVIQLLSESGLQTNVLYVDRDDPLTPDRLEGYNAILMPDCELLPDDAEQLIRERAAQGVRVAAIGKVAPDMYEYAFRYRKDFELLDWVRKSEQLALPLKPSKDFGVALHRVKRGYLLNLVNYRLNTISRAIEELPETKIALSFAPKSIEVHMPPGQEYTTASFEDGILTIRHAGIYTAIEMEVEGC